MESKIYLDTAFLPFGLLPKYYSYMTLGFTNQWQCSNDNNWELEIINFKLRTFKHKGPTLINNVLRFDSNPLYDRKPENQIEGSEEFKQSTQLIFDMIDDGQLTAVTSSITLSEVLVMPYRLGRIDLVENYRQTLTSNENTEYVPI